MEEYSYRNNLFAVKFIFTQNVNGPGSLGFASAAIIHFHEYCILVRLAFMQSGKFAY